MVIKKKKMNLVLFGASSAIGSFLTKKYYDLGYNLFLIIRNKEHLNKYKRKYTNNKNQKVVIKYFNFKNEKNLKKFVMMNKEGFKNSDFLVNCYGEQGEIKNFFDINLKKFKKTIDINFFFNIYLIKFIFPFIRTKKNYLIIFFSGGGALSLRKNFSSYSISKIALIKFTEIISEEFNNKNIRVNILSPGIVLSKMTKKILSKSKFVSKQELLKIKKFSKHSDKTLKKIFLTINFLKDGKGKKISGKIISSMWDDVPSWNKIKINRISKNDNFTLRRKI